MCGWRYAYTLPMFLLFPWLLHKLSFWPALAVGACITVLCFWLFAVVVKVFGIELL